MTESYLMRSLPVSELETGDVCRMDCTGEDREFDTCIVKQIDDSHVHFFRPYGHRERWSYSGGTICTIGIEEYRVERDSTSFKYFVYRRVDMR